MKIYRFEQVLLIILDSVTQLTLMAGISALVTAALPIGIGILGAIFLIAAMVMINYVIFYYAWFYMPKKQFFMSRAEVLYV